MDPHQATIYFINGNFLVYSKKDALFLRKKRIIGQLIGCCPKNPHQIATSNFPYLINHLAVSIILKNKLAIFKKFQPKECKSIKENESKFSHRISELQSKAESEFIEKRLKELKKRNIDPTPKRIGEFDISKLKVTVNDEPDSYLSTFDLVRMDETETKNELVIKSEKLIVYEDLYNKGFYLSSGMKFGSDFLAYFGDPVRYHAQYAVRVLSSPNEKVNISNVHYNEFNALNRLCHTANKILLMAIVYNDIFKHKKIKYWTTKQREILGPETINNFFQSIEPTSYIPNLTVSKRHSSKANLDSDQQASGYIKL